MAGKGHQMRKSNKHININKVPLPFVPSLKLRPAQKKNKIVKSSKSQLGYYQYDQMCRCVYVLRIYRGYLYKISKKKTTST